MDGLRIIEMYFGEGKTIQEIAALMKSTKQNIYEYIKRDARYENEAARRKAAKALEVFKMSQKIIRLYYENHKKAFEIAKEVKLSNSTITYIIKKDVRYKLEKEKRKKESLKRNRELSKKIKSQKRNESKDDIIMSNLKLLQMQNAISMSRTRKISNVGIVEINLSHYKYNSQKLEFDRSCGAKPFDLPRSIGIHSLTMYEGKTYEKNKV